MNDVLIRGPNRGILSIVKTVRAKGDVAIYTDAAKLDSYANINDYPDVKNFIGPFVRFQPILYIREAFSAISRFFYKGRLANRDWIKAKIVVLRMDANRMDQNSPEYQRQLVLLERYSNELSKIDQKISEYENRY